MTIYFVKTLGGQALGDDVALMDESYQARVQTASSAGRGGRASSGSVHDTAILTLSGTCVAADPTDPGSIRSAWDRLKAICRPGVAQPLLIDDDRYINVELASEIKTTGWGGLSYRDWSVTLASYDDPPWWSVAATTVNLAVGDNALPTAGNAHADPVFTITTSGAGSVSLTVAGVQCVLNAPAAGTFVVDSVSESVTQAGADVTQNLSLTSAFLRLQAGNNTLTVASAVLTSASVSFQDRWR